MSYITRSLEKVVQQVTQEYPVVLVTGPRQVGKTTMLQKLMEGTSRGYVSLDDLNERALAKNDPELFLQLHKPPVLIDVRILCNFGNIQHLGAARRNRRHETQKFQCIDGI